MPIRVKTIFLNIVRCIQQEHLEDLFNTKQ